MEALSSDPLSQPRHRQPVTCSFSEREATSVVSKSRTRGFAAVVHTAEFPSPAASRAQDSSSGRGRKAVGEQVRISHGVYEEPEDGSVRGHRLAYFGLDARDTPCSRRIRLRPRALPRASREVPGTGGRPRRKGLAEPVFEQIPEPEGPDE